MRAVPVLIAGGGPIGLTLGHALASFGVKCLLVERNRSTSSHPKMDLTNGRSMELYRRLGLVDRIRAVGVPQDHDSVVAWVTNPAGYELHRFTYPSLNEMRKRIRAVNDGTMPSQAPQRISQVVLEPLLKEALEEQPTAAVAFGVYLESFEQDAHGVRATLIDNNTGAVQKVHADYLIGCDGGGSTVRRGLGIPLEGVSQIRSSYMVHFRSSRRDILQRWGVVWHCQGQGGTIIAQDDKEHWTLQARLDPALDPESVDPRELLREFIGEEINAEILVANPWAAHALVAESYRTGRVFLAGDSAHQYVPTGGYGMNTGVGDAMDLGWKLAATLQGWGGPALLDSYEAERRPVGLRNREAARRNLAVRMQIGDYYAAAGDIRGCTSEAAGNRRTLARQIAAAGNLENEAWGVEFGYRYIHSPIVPPARAASTDDPAVYCPNTVPGSRLPSVVLGDGALLHDRLGPWFTLIAFDGADLGDFEAVSRSLRIPAAVVRVPEANLLRIYEQPLILVRPDDHVAWRGAAAPADWRPVLRLATGNAVRAGA
jgi:2-polyprenyl-6-methoxyphenol hydroxylase-like FAD-dependent oxidoreductase